MYREPIGNGLRFAILNRDNYTCQYCGAAAPDVKLHIDHIVPVADGGRSTVANLITACVPCNLGKRTKRVNLSIPRGTILEQHWPTDFPPLSAPGTPIKCRPIDIFERERIMAALETASDETWLEEFNGPEATLLEDLERYVEHEDIEDRVYRLAQEWLETYPEHVSRSRELENRLRKEARTVVYGSY